jgi:hypothetical protein
VDGECVGVKSTVVTNWGRIGSGDEEGTECMRRGRKSIWEREQ